MKKFLKRITARKNDNGFSLLELVVAIGILLVLTVGGLIGYSAISNNAKQAAVERAASDVIKAIAIKESSSSFTASNISFQTNVTNVGIYKVPQDAADEWMTTAGDKNKIIVTATEEDNLLTVKAVYDKNEKISATKTATMSSIRSGSNEDIPGGEDSEETPSDEDSGTGLNAISEFTYKCDVDSEGHIAPMNFKDGAEVTMTGGGKTESISYSEKPDEEKFAFFSDIVTGKTAAESVVMKANVEYTIQVKGQFDNIGTVISIDQAMDGRPAIQSCLTSIDRIDDNSGVKEISNLGGIYAPEKLNNMPEKIPSTVTSLFQTFYNTKEFNDDLSTWDTSNIESIKDIFNQSNNFTANLSNWDLSSLNSLKELTNGSSGFNANLSNWNTSNITDMSNAFYGAESFNQNISDWDTSNVTNMISMFEKASSFTSDLSGWETGKVNNMRKMFYEASNFTSDLSGWEITEENSMETSEFGRWSKLTRDLVPEKITHDSSW